MRELLIATGNKGKFPEITAILGDIPFTFKNLNDLGYPEGFEVEEPGSTFESNAIIKAMTWGKRSGKLTIAEDSGFVVDALDGRPGVYSARYIAGTDQDRFNKILEEMKDVPDGKRTARFVAVVAIYDPEHGDKVRLCEGSVAGTVTREPIGTNGFGYDPIFRYDETGKTGGEMTKEEKNTVSHRGRAMRKAREILLAEFV